MIGLRAKKTPRIARRAQRAETAPVTRASRLYRAAVAAEWMPIGRGWNTNKSVGYFDGIDSTNVTGPIMPEGKG
jgi:hypothetical protein